MDWREFLKSQSTYALMVWRFPIRYFLVGCSMRVQVYVWLKVFFESLLFLFFIVIYLFGLSVMFFQFPYFAPKLFCSLCIPLLMHSCFLRYIVVIIIIIIIIYSFRVFHIRVSWWFFTGVWVTASLLKSPGLVSGFWPFSAMLSFG